METRLNPVTLYKLRAFEKRRRRLIVVRGICAVVAAMLFTMSAVAFVDLLFVLPDTIRLILSLAAYGFVFAVFYTTSLRWLIRPANLRDLARMFEERREELKEEVLSAVELGEPRKRIWDSEQLRAMLQRQVAALVKGYKIRKLLPVSAIGKWILLAAVIVAISAALVFIPELQYAKLMARAFAPTANIARVSALQIEIVEPSDPERLIPRGDPVTIVAQLSEPWQQDVLLESFTDKPQEPVTLEMEPIGNQRFAATLLVARESLTYRVFAGKASTRYYTVQSRPRPAVRRFQKTYHYPAYSRLASEQVVETTGDVKALEGSTVDLKIEVDQPVIEAELRLDVGEEKQAVQLSTADEKLLGGRIVFRESGTYRVHLVARETKFENKFAPNYEISVIPDLVPSVRLEKPEKNLIVPSDALIRLVGSARDDLGLTSVTQMSRVNAGRWEEKTLATDSGKESRVKRDWDLLDMELKSGDQVFTKLVATDVGGNRGESLVAQITISSPGFSVQRLKDLTRQRNLLGLLERLRDTATQLHDQVKKLQEEFKKSPDDRDKHRETLLNAQATADELELRGRSAWSVLRDVMRQSDSSDKSDSRRQVGDTMLLGRLLSRLRHDALDRAHRSLQFTEANRTLTKERVTEAERATGNTLGLANQLYNAHKVLLARQEAQSIREEVERLAANQAKMLTEAKRPVEDADEMHKLALSRRLARQQQAAVREQQLVEEMLDKLAEHSEYNQSRQAESTRKKLERQRLEIEDVLAQAKPPVKQLLEQSQDMANRLAEASQELLNTQRGIRSRASTSRAQLTQALGKTADEVAQLKWKVENLAGRRSSLQRLQSQPNVEPKRIDEQRLRTAQAGEEAEHRWGSAGEQLKDRSRLEDIRPNPDYLFVDDTANTAAALGLLETAAIEAVVLRETTQALNRVEKAYRTLEAGHDLHDSSAHLQDMVVRERWEPARDNTTLGALREWGTWEGRVKTVPKQLGNVGIPGEIRNALYEVFKSESFKAIGQVARAAQEAKRTGKPLAEQMETVVVALGEVCEKLEPHLEEARKVIAEYAPSLVEQLRAVSQESEELKEETEQLTDSLDSQPASGGDDVREAAGQLLREQLALNEQLDTVRDGLRRDANIQDLGTEEGRERARDADDATALLRQPPPRAEDLLRRAARTSEPQAQAHALDSALGQQEKLADALELITQHYENLEAGGGEETRLALRQAEEEMLVAQELGSQYNQADSLAQMAQMPPEQLRGFLEAQLPRNQDMQAELGQIVDDTLQNAIGSLKDMVGRERDIADRLDRIAQKQNEQDQEHTWQDGRLRELTERAWGLAAEAKELAQEKIAQASEKAREGEARAEQHFDEATAAVMQAAGQIPQELQPSAGQLAEGVEQFAKTMDEAKKDLDRAARKAQGRAGASEQAKQATELAREAEHQAGELAEVARQIAEDLEDLIGQQDQANRQLAKADRREQQLAQKARGLAKRAEQLALTEIPALSRKAEEVGAQAMVEFASAMKAARTAAEQMPTDFAALPAALAEQVDDFAENMDQAKQDLQAAANKTERAGNKQNRQQAKAAGQQTRNAQKKALNLGKEARQLARDMRQIGQQRSARLEHTDQHQREINEAAPQVADDIARAAVHAERLGRSDAAALQQTGEAMQTISRNELPLAQQALDRARRARQAQPQVNQAYDALAGVLDNIEELGQSVGSEQAYAASTQPSQALDETGRWMARALDRLEAAAVAADNQPVQAVATQQAQQAVRRPLQNQQVAMAQGRAEQMAAAQAPSMTRQQLTAMMSGNKMTDDMPPETRKKLPEEVILSGGEWGKLRQLNAKELMEARGEAVAEDYRAMVHTYFRVISQRAKQKNW